MLYEDFKNKSADELKEILAELKTQLREMRFKALSRQLKPVHKMKAARKNIARVNMLLRQK